MKTKTSSPGNWLIVDRRDRMGSVFGAGLAFSLIEIMVVVSLMTVIILGLVAMFGQTPRAFRSSSGRTAGVNFLSGKPRLRLLMKASRIFRIAR